MPTYYARKAGNINAADVWATAPAGTASAVTFAAGDVLMANSFAITVNVSTNLGATGEVRIDTFGGATAGGSFTLSNGVTLTANVFAASAICVTYSGTAGNSASIVGNITGGAAGNAHGASNTSTGTLNITGNCTGGTAGSGMFVYGVNNNSFGTINISGNCIGGTGNASGAAHGANNASTGTLNITGVCSGGNTTVTANGANNASTGTMLINGVIQASEFAAGVGGTNRQQVTLLTGPFLISPTFGVNPIACTAWRWASALNNQTYIEVSTQTLLQKRNLVTPDNATNFPAASNVRSGITYGIGGVVSGTCVVPNPSVVAAGSPVDDTVGTLTISVPTASEIATAVWGASTKTITGGVVDTLTNAPTVPTPSQIASQVRTELSTELGRLDASVSSRLASADYTAPTSAPTAAAVASAVRTELTELSNLDASVSSRLASASYTAPANSDISAIKSKTDNLPASPAAVSDIPTTAQIATAVEGSLLNEADGSAVLNALVGAIGNQNVDEIALVAAIRSDLERSGGKLDSIPTTAAPTAAQNATAVWGAATKDITGGTVTNLTNAPASVTPTDIWSHATRTLTSASGPTAVEIRQEMDSSSTKLSAIKSKTDNLPADPADQSLLEAAIAGVAAPTAGQVASQVRTELSSELAKVAALNTERLANVATTAIVGNLIAQANS